MLFISCCCFLRSHLLQYFSKQTIFVALFEYNFLSLLLSSFIHSCEFRNQFNNEINCKNPFPILVSNENIVLELTLMEAMQYYFTNSEKTIRSTFIKMIFNILQEVKSIIFVLFHVGHSLLPYIITYKINMFTVCAPLFRSQ